jgi:hypothetical protein
MYGYRPAEVGILLADNELPDPSFEVIRIKGGFYYNKRRPVRRTLGCHYVGATCPVPDFNHGPSQIAAAVKRVGAKMPQINKVFYRKFKRFVKRFIKKEFKDDIFKIDENFDFEEWISNAPYEEYRKNELRKVYKESRYSKIRMEVDCFVKDESYPDWKHVRNIMSRHDEYKCEMGPFFKKFGDILFKKKWFIKKIPINDRPAFLAEKFKDLTKLFCNDFSQFEATFVRQLMQIELMVYDYLLQKNPHKKRIHDLFVRGIMGDNKLKFKEWSMSLNSKRMSGEMNTSCGNGLMNLLLIMFLCKEKGNTIIETIIEGDDSLTAVDKELPTSEDFEKLGAKVKIEIPRSLSTASFCGNVFDENILHNVANPLEALVCFGYCKSKYVTAGDQVLKKLLRAKSLSMLYSYPGCPILRELAEYGLRATIDIDNEECIDYMLHKTSLNTYDRDFWKEIKDRFKLYEFDKIKINDKTRQLVEEMYKIPIKLQIDFEEYLKTLTNIQPLVYPQLLMYMPKPWIEYYDRYSIKLTITRNFHKKDYFIYFSGIKTKYYLNPTTVVYDH